MAKNHEKSVKVTILTDLGENSIKIGILSILMKNGEKVEKVAKKA